MNVQVKDKKEQTRRFAAYKQGMKKIRTQKGQDHTKKPVSTMGQGVGGGCLW